MKTFEEFINSTSLPNTAKDQLPMVLRTNTKRQLLSRADAEEIISAAVKEINHRSFETMDVLVRKRL